MRPRAALGLLLASLALPVPGAEPSALDLFVQPARGHCSACHQLSDGAVPATRNDVGPRLEGARMRELGREALREILRDPTARNPETVMPPYGRHRLLDESEISQLVEFLHALP